MKTLAFIRVVMVASKDTQLCVVAKVRKNTLCRHMWLLHICTSESCHCRGGFIYIPFELHLESVCRSSQNRFSTAELKRSKPTLKQTKCQCLSLDLFIDTLPSNVFLRRNTPLTRISEVLTFNIQCKNIKYYFRYITVTLHIYSILFLFF